MLCRYQNLIRIYLFIPLLTANRHKFAKARSAHKQVG